jgi:hypothetical protein
MRNLSRVRAPEAGHEQADDLVHLVVAHHLLGGELGESEAEKGKSR